MIALLALSAAWAGEIAGTLVDTDGNPVEGAWVVAYDQRLNYAWALSNAAGSWEITNLPANPYRVRVLPPMDVDLVEQWATGALSVCEGTIHKVPSTGGPDDVHLVLEPGGVLEGILTSTAGEPVPDALVVARSADDTPIAQARYDTSDEDGRFTIQGLPPELGSTGAFRLEVTVTGWPRQVLPGEYEKADGTRYEIAPGQTQDVGEHRLLDGITVSGTVSGPDGPVSEADVHVYSASQVVSLSAEDGVYTAEGLPPGSVVAWANATGLAMTYHPDEDRPGTSVPAEEEGQHLEDVDVEAPYESILRGRIGSDGQDMSGVTLLAYNDTRTVGIGDQVDEDGSGSFSLGRLHEGSYTLLVYAADEGYVSDFVRDAAGDPVVYDLPFESATEVHAIDLPRGARVHGVVRDLYSGQPVYGAYVQARGQETGETVATSTDAEGAYELVGLPADRWRLWVEHQPYCDGDPSWVSIWHGHELREDFSGRVTLAAGDVLEWDPELPPDMDHDAMDDVWEDDHGLDPTRDDSGEDPDEDGYTNLEEYLLGTDPMDGGDRRRGCGCGGGGGAAVVALLPLWRRRRRR